MSLSLPWGSLTGQGVDGILGGLANLQQPPVTLISRQQAERDLQEVDLLEPGRLSPRLRPVWIQARVQREDEADTEGSVGGEGTMTSAPCE